LAPLYNAVGVGAPVCLCVSLLVTGGEGKSFVGIAVRVHAEAVLGLACIVR